MGPVSAPAGFVIRKYFSALVQLVPFPEIVVFVLGQVICIIIRFLADMVEIQSAIVWGHVFVNLTLHSFGKVLMPLSLVTWTLFVVAFVVSLVIALVALGNAV